MTGAGRMTGTGRMTGAAPMSGSARLTTRNQRLRHAVFMRSLPVIPFAALLVVWAVGWEVAHPSLVTMPSIAEVGHTVRQLTGSGKLQANISASMYRWGLGFGTGAVSGVVFGLLAGLRPLLARMIEPVVSFFTAISGIVWLPIAIVWFGLGTATVIFIIWNSVFFLVFANTVLGVRSVATVLEDAARTLGASRAHIITRVVIPGALPHILEGLRSGVGFGWRALIAAEIIGATTGLGAMIYQAKEFLRSDIIITGVIIIAAIGLLLDAVLGLVERRTIERWGLVTTEGARTR
jgi:NitT/TauT family transport system permease protein/taurine transport system permease protein